MTRNRLRLRYDEMWSTTIGKIRSGQVELDPVLAAQAGDERRGLTVVARPSAPVRRRAQALVRQMRQIEPDQYYYAASELHVTILSLFTATEHHASFFARKDQYISAVSAALKNAELFVIRFEGVTVSPGTMMIQGFFESNALNRLRDTLRQQLWIRGLGAGVDERYRLETAHMTVARFRAPLRDGHRFAMMLEQARTRRFGTSIVRSLSLVANDWYLSRHSTEVLKRYRLGERSMG